jgi:hypothetical protein
MIGAHRIACGLLHLLGGDLDAGGLGAFQLVADDFGRGFSSTPQLLSSAETSSPLPAIGQSERFHEAPRALSRHIAGLIAQLGEERGPFGAELGGVFLVVGVKLIQIGGIAAIKE